MQEGAEEAWEDAEGIHGFFSAFGMDGVKGEAVGGEAVEPVEFAGDAQTAFVGMEDGLARELFADGGLEGGEVVGTGFDRAENDGLADRVAEEIMADPAGALKGDVLLAVEIDQESAETLPILRGRDDTGRERGARCFAAAGTAFGLGAIFGDVEFGFGQFEDLATVRREAGFVFRVELVATRAGGETEFDDVIRDFDQFERLAGMTGLAAGFASGASAQGFGRGLGQTVGRRRLAAVGAVLAKLPFQVGHALLQGADLFLERENQFRQRERMGRRDDLDFFTPRHGRVPPGSGRSTDKGRCP